MPSVFDEYEYEYECEWEWYIKNQGCKICPLKDIYICPNWDKYK